jgi:putative flippase GtrA
LFQNTKIIANKLYRHSFVRYVVIGGTSFVIDFLLLVALHGSVGMNVLVAASISYWTSIIFNFLANRFWTFEATEQSIMKHVAAYLLLLAANYLFTIAIIALGQQLGIHYTIAKVIAVIIQMAWTYLVYKKVIFKTRSI